MIAQGLGKVGVWMSQEQRHLARCPATDHSLKWQLEMLWTSELMPTVGYVVVADTEVSCSSPKSFSISQWFVMWRPYLKGMETPQKMVETLWR